MAKWKRCGLQNRHCGGSIPPPASLLMNPEFWVDRLPKIGRAINVVALASVACAFGLAMAPDSQEVIALAKSVHSGSTLVSGFIVGLDAGLMVGLTSGGNLLSKENGLKNPVRIQNFVLTLSNIAIQIMSNNLSPL